MFRQGKILSALLLFMIALSTLIPYTAASGDKVYHVPIENEVEKGLLAFLERSFNEATEQNAKAIILDIHTPGGFVDAAVDIGKLMDETDIPIYAFINTKAHSAGAFIALHADEIYMTDGATIGSAAVIDSAGNAADEKANSAWLAQMEAAAEKSGRDPQYALAMADKTIDLPQYRAPEGKLLTLSANEAIEVGYAEGLANTLEEVVQAVGLQGAQIVDMEVTLAEKIARFITHPVVIPILLSIGSLGLVMELYSPGFGIPGIMGLGSLGLFFFGHMVAGFAGYETLIVFAIGFILVIAEFFVPGGILGIIGGILMVGSILFAGASFIQMAYSLIIAFIIAIIGMVIFMKFFGKKLHVFNKLVLKDATTTEDGYVSNTNRIELIGKIGEAITPLRPAGTVIIDDERLDVVTEGGYIDAGVKVEVTKVEGSRIVVRNYIEKMEE